MKRGVHTKVETKAIPTPVPELLADVPSKSEGASKASKGEKKKAQAEARDADADDVLQYAREHPEEDVEIEVENKFKARRGISRTRRSNSECIGRSSTYRGSIKSQEVSRRG